MWPTRASGLHWLLRRRQSSLQMRTLGTVVVVPKVVPRDETAQEQRKKPTILLLGWAFAKEQQLAKFASFYNSLGYDTLSYTLPSPHFFIFNHAKASEDAEKLVAQLKDMPGETVVLQPFSNNGYPLLQHVVRILCDEPQQSSRELRISGAIFDSGPVPFTALGFLGAPFGFQLGLTGKPRRSFLFFAYVFLQFMTEKSGIWRPLMTALSLRGQLRENWRRFYPLYGSPAEHLLENRRSYPQLFLYSTADQLAFSKFFDLAIAQQRAAGQTVFGHNFEKSGHVAHLKNFPKVYEEKVKEFLQYVETQ